MTAATSGNGGVFNTRIIAALIVAGILGFIGFWAVTALAPEIDPAQGEGGHALSVAATGFSGVVALAQAAGIDVGIDRGERGTSSATSSAPSRPDAAPPPATPPAPLLVLTPTGRTTAQAMRDRAGDYDGPILVILPKYRAPSDRRRPGWQRDPVPLTNPGQSMAIAQWNSDGKTQQVVAGAGARAIANFGGGPFDAGPAVAVPLPRGPLTVLAPDGDARRAALLRADGRHLLARLDGDRPTYVLADPDLLNNLAMADDDRALAAVALLRGVAGPGRAIRFDVVLSGMGAAQQSLLRLAFTPPFLALTLCLIAAMLFALWHGFLRFGPAWRTERAVAFGKAGLVANSALLIVQARRTTHFAVRYGASVREIAARRLHAPAALTGAALDRWLDRFADANGRRFSTLLADLETARNPTDAVRGAAALGQWKKDVLRDGN